MEKEWNELKATITELRDNNGTGTQQEVCKFLVNLMDRLEKQMSSSEKPNEWIPLISRPMTEEEREEYKGMAGITENMILNCPLPDDGQEVFVSYGDYVCIDTFHDDDGCYFEDVEIDEVDAWMPLPPSYKAERENKND